MTFEQLNLIEPILRALQHEGYENPTPIQEESIPGILKGNDLLGCAQTGTGKTAAFAIPVLQLLYNQGPPAKAHRPIRALILTPTRELAIQIDESFGAYGKHTGLRHSVIFGGVSQHKQTMILQSGIDILTATPGRLLDLMNQRFVHLEQVHHFILDEADRMLDMGFLNDVKKIIAKLPHKRQTLFFSATMPPEISRLADTILSNPQRVEVSPVSSTAEKVKQALYFVDQKNKRNLLVHLLADKAITSALVFTRTKHGADRLVKELTKVSIKAEAIHGNKSQAARQKALTNFKSGVCRVLVATDIAARGIDVDNLSHVVNYELPNVPETYVHRIGRTGRAGASGIAFSFCDQEEQEFLHDIVKLTGLDIEVVENQPFHMVMPAYSPAKKKKSGPSKSFKPNTNLSGRSHAPSRPAHRVRND